jgi:hypothetical protein
MKIEFRKLEDNNVMRLTWETPNEERLLIEWYEGFMLGVLSDSLIEIGCIENGEWKDYDLK